MLLLTCMFVCFIDKKSLEIRFGVASLTKKNKELTKFSPFLKPYKGREEQV